MDRAVQADLRSAEHALRASPPLTEDACFHAQQAVEKSLKAFLVHATLNLNGRIGFDTY